MTRIELSEQINRLEVKAEAARNGGDSARLYRTLCEIKELQEAAGVQPHEFGGGV